MLHIPKDALMLAVENTLPKEFDSVVFSQWDESRQALVVGFSHGEGIPEESMIEAGDLN